MVQNLFTIFNLFLLLLFLNLLLLIDLIFFQILLFVVTILVFLVEFLKKQIDQFLGLRPENFTDSHGIPIIDISTCSIILHYFLTILR